MSLRPPSLILWSWQAHWLLRRLRSSRALQSLLFFKNNSPKNQLIICIRQQVPEASLTPNFHRLRLCHKMGTGMHTAQQFPSIVVNHCISTAHTAARPWSATPCRCAPNMCWAYFEALLLPVPVNPIAQILPNGKFGKQQTHTASIKKKKYNTMHRFSL